MVNHPSQTNATLCHFVPRWPGNPYHTELAEHLSGHGVEVAAEDGLKGIAKASRASGKLPGVIHLHAFPRFGLEFLDASRFAMFWLRLFWFQFRGVRVVWTIHDIFHHEALYPKVDLAFSRLLYRKADAIIVHSAAAGRAVEKQWDVKADARLFVVPHGNYIDSYPNAIGKDEARKKLGVPAGKLTFLFLGMIRPYKGVVGLIEKFKQLADPDTYLLIAGKPLSAELSDEISAAAGAHPGIQYRPAHIEDTEMQDYLNAADVVVFPYTKALTSGALILAMSYARACIAPKMGALEDTLDEEGGFLYEPADSKGLLTAMQLTISGKAKLAAMGEYNMTRAVEWDWDGVAKLTAAIYHQQK